MSKIKIKKYVPELKCKRCGLKSTVVKTVNDPYEFEIKNNIVRKKLCPNCIDIISKEI